MMRADNPCDRPNSITCSSLIDSCLKMDEIDLAFGVLMDMRLNQVPLNEVTYTSLITELTRLKQLDRIVDIVEGEPESGTPPVMRSWQQEINALSARTKKRQANFFCADNGMGDTPWTNIGYSDSGGNSRKDSSKGLSTPVLEELVKLLSDAERVDAALDILDSTVGYNQLPSPNVVKVVLSAVESAKELERTRELMIKITQMLGTSSNDAYSKACAILLAASDRADVLKDAIEALSPIWRDQLEIAYDTKAFVRGPDTKILDHTEYHDFSTSKFSSRCGDGADQISVEFYNKIKVYHDQGDYDEVIRLFGEMKVKDEHKVSNPRVYRILMEAVYRRSCDSCEVNEWEGGLFRLYLVLQEMKIAGIQADTATYNTLINACAAIGDVERAMDTVENMQSDGVAPDVITYTSLIKAFAISCSREEWIMRNNSKLISYAVQAESLFTEMQQKANHFSKYIEPTELTFSRLMQVHLACGNTTRIWELFSLMKSRGISPSVYSYRTCFQAAYETQNIEKALVVLDEVRPYSTQQRLGVQYNSIPEFYAEVYTLVSIPSIFTFHISLFPCLLKYQTRIIRYGEG